MIALYLIKPRNTIPSPPSNDLINKELAHLEIPQVTNEIIRLFGTKLTKADTSGGHRQTPGADAPGASNIVQRIPDHQNLLSPQGTLEP